MLYKGKAIEIISTKEVFGEHITWIRILEDNSFLEVGLEELQQEDFGFSMAYRHCGKN
jgi:hypothetical protein